MLDKLWGESARTWFMFNALRGKNADGSAASRNIAKTESSNDGILDCPARNHTNI